ncbi:hypothetical protein HMPREF3291_19660 [Bacillus sp. HMSC76G11]|uniref:Uncharacterized protein n=1 Tax=Metabacillus idriensis TaxID=324768 RepID=A0A6I2MAZ1_9BACI|nr:hypothetical protein [Metabacillus idriensis]MRX54136.1 hypothetical protein [Metabacillus idriensis]OHR73263.1 hypothetical protein HMPREF3291_19660 [Bacillus sp. HMSC76G11]
MVDVLALFIRFSPNIPKVQKRRRLGQIRQADKNPTEKSRFNFFGGFVLTEDLGAGAGRR